MIAFKKIISKYSSAVDKVSEPVDLYSELMNIKNGDYKDIIDLCRELYSAGNKADYSKKKKFLPAVTFSGEFEGSRKADSLKAYSYFIIIDIDALEKETIPFLKKELFEDEFVAAIWISPSGHGLKILIATTSSSQYHKQCFDAISEYLSNRYGINVDKSGSDICRLCFVSYDENLLLKEEVIPFKFTEQSFTQQVKRTQSDMIELSAKISALRPDTSLKKLFYETEGKNNRSNRDIIGRIIKYLRKNNLSITGNYHDWFRVACAIANSFTHDIGEKYYLELCRLDNDLHDEYKSQNLLEYCYRNRKAEGINFATIVFLAGEKGFILKKNKN